MDKRLVGESRQIADVRRLVRKAAHNRLPVLLLGETGSGKEVVARAIHDANQHGQFVPIDCGALVGTLMETELFGHTRGAFSGAAEQKRGLVEVADGGTAFFDEIGDLPLEMQVKLLRLIQEKEFRAVGSLQWRKVDIRIIAATHRNLKAEVAAGRFREDLYHRLNVFTIHLPPLRARRDDIPVLIEHFLARAEEAGLPPFQLSPEMQELLTTYDWPGNVRELKHCLERMAAMSSEGVLETAALPSPMQQHLANASLERLSVAITDSESDALPPAQLRPRSPVISIPDTVRQSIEAALVVTRGERGKAAELLEISRTTLYRRMKEYGIQ